MGLLKFPDHVYRIDKVKNFLAGVEREVGIYGASKTREMRERSWIKILLRTR